MTVPPTSPIVQAEAKSTLRILSLNIQMGLSSTHYRHYVTQAWRHVLPSRGVTATLDRIAELAHDYDVVVVQEADAGSLRTAGLNQVRYLAEQTGFTYWHAAVNRNLGPIAQHCLGCFSRLPLSGLQHHRLPGRLRGRGALEMELHPNGHQPLHLIVAHLALGQKSRAQQLAYLATLANRQTQTIIVGDFNCGLQELRANSDIAAAGLRILGDAPTFPSWSPRRTIDHVLVTPDVEINSSSVLNLRLSDHLPIAVEVALQTRDTTWTGTH
ncbi:MAG TPA: endonuclease/exonuclease/phosphatase family protein [Stenotrophobium sp.]|nr:endonuclease/exonuclease/phosphatase family protein [Stenotrophobium sp.]